MMPMAGFKNYGWLPDFPDYRDYTPEKKEMKTMLKGTPLTARKASPNGSVVDLREWCSPIEDQGKIGSCTACAGVGLLEFMERKAFGKHINASRLFLYKVSRNLLHWNGDTGAFLRTMMQALVMFGVPPEEYYRYYEESYDAEPDAFVYSMAQNYQALEFFRLDPPGTSRQKLMDLIKKTLRSKIPIAFGFSVFQSIDSVGTNGKVPFPKSKEQVTGGHAVCIVGYDDKMENKGISEKGALLIKNSWGRSWGEDGYCWMPYAYVSRGLSADFWSLVSHEWIDTGHFKE